MLPNGFQLSVRTLLLVLLECSPERKERVLVISTSEVITSSSAAAMPSSSDATTQCMHRKMPCNKQ